MLDFCIFIFLVIFLLLGFLRGLKKEFNSLINLFLFITISYFYANFIGRYIFSLIDYDSSNFSQYSYPIVGCIIVFFSTKIFISFISRIFFNSYDLINNIFFDKFFGVIFGLCKGVVLLSTFFLTMRHYDNFHLITNFDNNSLFLDYFLHFGVQLQHVWNHWYSWR